MNNKRTIALVAHDHKKQELVNWSKDHLHILKDFRLVATGTTGKILEEHLKMEVHKLQSGPLGGDQQLGAMISEQKIDLLIFFWDPLEPQPHDPDVKALLRIATVWNLPVASNRASADMIISSPLLYSGYTPSLPQFKTYLNREIK